MFYLIKQRTRRYLLIMAFNWRNTLQFTSRAEAYAYMLAYLIEEKQEEPLTAAHKANEFAELYAVNMGVPTTQEPQVNGIDKYLQMAEKVGNFCDSHPRATEILIGAVTFVAGVVAGKQVPAIAEPAPAPPPIEPIDFNNLV